MTTTKIAEVFGKDKIIDRSINNSSFYFGRMPRFVSDFLIASFVDKKNPTDGFLKINSLIKNHFFDSEEKDLIKSKIHNLNRYILIGKIKVRFDQSMEQYWCDIPVLSDSYVRINKNILDKYGDTLLVHGAWAKMEIWYDPCFKIKNKSYPFYINSFEPLQVTNIDLNKWIQNRKNFTKEEWLHILINTIGLNPQNLSYEENLLHICRLIPFVQPNTHLIELGPTETAKTYCYRNVSPYSHVITGSSVTVAGLFYNKIKRAVGILGLKDVVCFDEITTNNIKIPTEVINMLKDALNSGKFTRDNLEFTTQASVVFIGNTNINNNHFLLRGMPDAIGRDRAFLDRINGIIPGWHFSKISPSNYSKSCGFMLDYFAEIMHKLRNINYAPDITKRLNLGVISQRNESSIVNIICGLTKLMYPDTNLTNDDLKELIQIATSFRQSVIDQMKILSPQEFGDINLNISVE